MWLGTADEKAAHVLALTRIEEADLPHVTTGEGERRRVRRFPDRLPIGVHLAGRGVVVYVVTDPTLDDFREFLERHAALLRALPAWTLRIVVPRLALPMIWAFIGASAERSVGYTRAHGVAVGSQRQSAVDRALTHALQQARRHAEVGLLQAVERILQRDQFPFGGKANDAERAGRLKAVFHGGLTPFPFVEENELGTDIERQSDGLAFAPNPGVRVWRKLPARIEPRANLGLPQRTA